MLTINATQWGMLNLLAGPVADNGWPWLLFLFLGLGYVLQLMLGAWLFDRFYRPVPYKPIDPEGWGKLASAGFFFLYFIIAVSIRSGFEWLWGDRAANLIGSGIELLLIVVFGFVSSRRRGKSD